MNEDDRQAFGEVLADMFGYYKEELSSLAFTVYFNALKKFSVLEITEAVSQFISYNEYSFRRPQPSQIANLITGSPGSRVLLASKKLREAIERYGPYRYLVFDDPLIHKIVEQMGGLVFFCQQRDEHELKFQMDRFQKFYRDFQGSRLPPGSYPSVLNSILHNEDRGLDEKERIYWIGEKDKAMAVMKSGSKSKVLLGGAFSPLDVQRIEDESQPSVSAVEP